MNWIRMFFSEFWEDLVETPEPMVFYMVFVVFTVTFCRFAIWR